MNGSQTCFEPIFCDFFLNYVGVGGGGALWFDKYITQRNLNSSAQQNRFNKSRIQAKIHLFFVAFCKVHLGRFGFKTARGLYSIPFTNFDGRLSWRSNSIPFFLINPSKKGNKMKSACYFRFEAGADTLQLRSRK